MTSSEFIQAFNAKRKANKNNWISMIETVDGKEIRLKSYNTWVQLLYVDGLKHSGPMDCPVKAVTVFLTTALQ